MSKNPLTFIRLLNECVPDSKVVFTQGGCFHLYLMLKEVFPDAIPIYIDGHVFTKIGCKHYDINGECVVIDGIDLRAEHRLFKKAFRWARQSKDRFEFFNELRK